MASTSCDKVFHPHEPYRAWSNLEFLADDGSLNEVDLLVFTPQGFFLIEIKSWPGRVSGDAGTWTWETDGRRTTVDNPLLTTNSKAKKLRSLLGRQKAYSKKGKVPWIDALVFLSDPDLKCDLTPFGRTYVCLRDREATGERPARKGIRSALTARDCPGLPPAKWGPFDRPMAKAVSQALEQAGIRPSQRMRRVGDYGLGPSIGEGPGYQDFEAKHVSISESRRRVRLYLVRAGATEENRRTINRAARREAQILESLTHPGILGVRGVTEHEVGPALLFESTEGAVRLDHFLIQRRDTLAIETQIDLVRQIAEAIRFAHGRRVIHRGLSPQSILALDPDSDRPRIKLFNWQIGFRERSTSATGGRTLPPTRHAERLVEDAATAYMAPEALTDFDTGEQLDVFSLGAIAYHVFSGRAPAADGVELSETLRGSSGLAISGVLDGAGPELVSLVQWSTHPVVANRLDTADDFLGLLDEVEKELTTPPERVRRRPPIRPDRRSLPRGVRDPSSARTGSNVDRIPRTPGQSGLHFQGGKRRRSQRTRPGRSCDLVQTGDAASLSGRLR